MASEQSGMGHYHGRENVIIHLIRFSITIPNKVANLECYYSIYIESFFEEKTTDLGLSESL